MAQRQALRQNRFVPMDSYDRYRNMPLDEEFDRRRFEEEDFMRRRRLEALEREIREERERERRELEERRLLEERERKRKQAAFEAEVELRRREEERRRQLELERRRYDEKLDLDLRVAQEELRLQRDLERQRQAQRRRDRYGYLEREPEKQPPRRRSRRVVEFERPLEDRRTGSSSRSRAKEKYYYPSAYAFPPPHPDNASISLDRQPPPAPIVIRNPAQAPVVVHKPYQDDGLRFPVQRRPTSSYLHSTSGGKTETSASGAQPLSTEQQAAEREAELSSSLFHTIANVDNPQDVTIHLELPIYDDFEAELEEFSILRRMGNFKEAKDYFDEHLGDYLSHPYVFVQYAEVLLDMGDYAAFDLLDPGAVFGADGRDVESQPSHARVTPGQVQTRESAGTTSYTRDESPSSTSSSQSFWDHVSPSNPFKGERQFSSAGHHTERQYTPADHEESKPSGLARRTVEGSTDEDLQLLQRNWSLLKSLVTIRRKGTLNEARDAAWRALENLESVELGDDEEVRIMRLGSTEMRIISLALQIFAHVRTLVPHNFWYEVKDYIWGIMSWPGMYKVLLLEGRIWDFRDVFVAATTLFGIEETLGVEGEDDEGWSRIMKDWASDEQDASTNLALLDIMTSIIHSRALSHFKKADLQEYFAAGQTLAERITKHQPEAMRSRPFCRWILAKAAEAEFKQINGLTDSFDSFVEHLGDHPGGGFCQSGMIKLPVYVPRGSENPGWQVPEQPPGAAEPIHAILQVAKGLEDYPTQVSCYSMLILRSRDPGDYFDELARVQKDVQGDNIGHLWSCLARYLSCKDPPSEKRLLEELRDTEDWSDPRELRDARIYWARDFIERALTRKVKGLPNLPRLRDPNMTYYRFLPANFQGFIRQYAGTAPINHPPAPPGTSGRHSQDPLYARDWAPYTSARGYSSRSRSPEMHNNRGHSRARSMTSASSSSGSASSEPDESKDEYPKKGKTRIPEKLVSKRALIDLGYPFVQEGSTIIVLKALGQENIDDLLKLSEDYKKAEVNVVPVTAPPATAPPVAAASVAAAPDKSDANGIYVKLPNGRVWGGKDMDGNKTITSVTLTVKDPKEPQAPTTVSWKVEDGGVTYSERIDNVRDADAGLQTARGNNGTEGHEAGITTTNEDFYIDVIEEHVDSNEHVKSTKSPNTALVPYKERQEDYRWDILGSSRQSWLDDDRSVREEADNADGRSDLSAGTSGEGSHDSDTERLGHRRTSADLDSEGNTTEGPGSHEGSMSGDDYMMPPAVDENERVQDNIQHEGSRIGRLRREVRDVGDIKGKGKSVSYRDDSPKGEEPESSKTPEATDTPKDDGHQSNVEQNDQFSERRSGTSAPLEKLAKETDWYGVFPQEDKRSAARPGTGRDGTPYEPVESTGVWEGFEEELAKSKNAKKQPRRRRPSVKPPAAPTTARDTSKEQEVRKQPAPHSQAPDSTRSGGHASPRRSRTRGIRVEVSTGDGQGQDMRRQAVRATSQQPTASPAQISPARSAPAAAALDHDGIRIRPKESEAQQPEVHPQDEKAGELAREEQPRPERGRRRSERRQKDGPLQRSDSGRIGRGLEERVESRERASNKDTEVKAQAWGEPGDDEREKDAEPRRGILRKSTV
ncbi:hypothetical protein NKR23_g9579 [Pleurostoma richardsiae]|uniref:DUF8035 domain-containing protein n=1 Tax=Pleurostoma richardsiae TaxID=41990 RepID=A0AA38R486_9PEZI|nr:hypothetical protein NKR23_g9579 [Pleurostoma richardsiae]